MKNTRTVSKRYIGLIVFLIIVLIGVVGGGAYWFIGASTTSQFVAYTSPPQVTGNCSAANISLVVDVSGSVQDDINNYKTNLAKFVKDTETATPNTNWSLTTFASEAQVKSNWTEDPTNLVNQINQLNAFGGTATASGIQKALNLQSDLLVQGAGTDANNGKYYKTGQYNGYPYYMSSNGKFIFVHSVSGSDKTWWFNDTLGGNSASYEVTGNYDTPPQDGWTVGDNSSPAPTVTEETDPLLSAGNTSKIMLILTDGLPNISLSGGTNTTTAINDAITQANAARAAGYSTVVVDVSSSGTSGTQADVLRGLAGTDVPTIAGNVIPATFSGLSSALADAFGCQTNTLTITKSVDNPTPIVGTDVNYTVTVKNNNTADQPKATNIKVDDTLPAGLTLKGTPNVTSGTFAAPIWTIPNLDQGQTTTLKMTATVNSEDPIGTAITNTSKITALDQSDDNTDDNTATATVTPQALPAGDILSITKSVDNSTPQVGTSVKYTITVKNNNATGGEKATNIVIKDTLPTGITFDKAESPSTGTYSDPNWKIPELTAGQTATIVIDANVDSNDTPDKDLVNTATIVSLDQTDNNTDNNKATATVTPSAEPTTPTPPATTTTTSTDTTPTPTSTDTTPTPTSTQSTTKVTVPATPTGPNTDIVYSMSAILSLATLGILYLFKRRYAGKA